MTRPIAATTGVVMLVLLPLVISASFHLHVLIMVLLFATLAQAWNLLGGYAGQLSFGHSVFFGLGAYTTAVLLSRYGILPWIGAPAGAILAAAVSLAIGTPTFRLRRHFFALATLALGEIVRITFLNWGYVGAAIGLYLPLQYRNQLAYLMWDSKRPYYYLALALLALAMTVVALVDRTRMGIYLKALNQDEEAARAIGIPTLRYKQWAMGISAAFAALAGAVYAQYVLYIDPYNVLTSRISLLVVVIALLGGRGTLWGPVLGSAFIILLSEYSRSALGYLGEGYDFILFGLLIMLVSLYEPRGLAGLLHRARPHPLPAIEGASDVGFVSAPQASGGVVLSVEAATKAFGGLVVLDHVDLAVRRGEILALIGPNGAGKSTLFDCITGFQRIDAGTVRLDGQDITHAAPHAVAHRGLVRTFQLIRVFPDLTVEENVLVAQPHAGESVWSALRHSSAGVQTQATTLLRMVGLLAHRAVPASQLSYGQQKLLSFGMALMTNAEVVLLDEPAAGVDPRLIQDMVAYIKDAHARGRTFVIIEHNIDVVNAVATRVYVMADGRILAEGTPGEIRCNPQVLEAYYGR
jgi:branched-chain amino acid transport system permease protein